MQAPRQSTFLLVEAPGCLRLSDRGRALAMPNGNASSGLCSIACVASPVIFGCALSLLGQSRVCYFAVCATTQIRFHYGGPMA